MTIQHMSGGAIPEVTLRDRLRIAREFAGFEQQELGERAGISRATISNAERGIREPNRATISMWAFACGVDLDWLRTGETGTTPSPDNEGVDAVRLKGLEPPTFCSVVSLADRRAA